MQQVYPQRKSGGKGRGALTWEREELKCEVDEAFGESALMLQQALFSWSFCEHSFII